MRSQYPKYHDIGDEDVVTFEEARDSRRNLVSVDTDVVTTVLPRSMFQAKRRKIQLVSQFHSNSFLLSLNRFMLLFRMIAPIQRCWCLRLARNLVLRGSQN